MESGAASGVMEVDACAFDFCACTTAKEKCSPADMCDEVLDGSGRSYLFRCRLLSSVTVKRRKLELLATSCLAALSLGVSEPALAVCTGTFAPLP